MAIQYLMDKYGEDKVCQVLNFSYLTPKVAIKDVASKILNIPYTTADRISKKFADATWQECLERNPTIYQDYPQYKEWFDIASKLAGKIKTTSVHAGGVCIVDGVMRDYMSMRLGENGSHIIEVDKREVEEIGIVKYDLLGVKNINIVQETCKLAGINEWEVNINNPEFETDKMAYDLITQGNTKLIFQMESVGMTDLAKKVKPTTLEELSSIIALYRPDSMPYIPNYLDGKANPEKIEYIHPDMEEILKPTYGSLIYQEQIMQIVQKYGGRTLGGADTFRKIIGKKLIDKMKAETDKLHQEIINNGYDEDTATLVSNMLAKMGNYSFNKSHSFAYAVLALQTAYLKAHYPVEFYTACFNYTDKAEISKYLVDAKHNHIKILPPNINKSENNFKVYNNSVLFGLESINGLGANTIKLILDERNQNGEFKSLQDFFDRIKPTESLMVSLIKAGALPINNKMDFLKKYLKKIHCNNKPYKPVKSLPSLNELNTKWGIDTTIYDTKEKRLKEYNKKKEILYKTQQEEKNRKKLNETYAKHLKDEALWEFETLNMFINNNPFDEIYEDITPPDDIDIGSNGVLVGVISKIQSKKDKNKNQFAFIEIYTTNGIVEVVCWHQQYKQYNECIKKGEKISLVYEKKESILAVKEINNFDEWLNYYNTYIKKGN